MSRFYIYGGELYHEGNKNSGRYPLGSGKRPYQHTGRSVRIRKTKTSDKIGLLERRKRKKALKEKEEAEKERVKAKAKIEEEKRKTQIEEQKWQQERERMAANLNKEKLLIEGKPEEILKYQSVLTTVEMKSALERINTTASLQSIAEKNMVDNWKRMNNATKRVKDINDAVGAAITASKNFQEIMAILEGTKSGKNKQKSS